MSERDDWAAMAGADEFDEEFLGPRRSYLIFLAIHAALSGAIWWWATQWAPQKLGATVHWAALILSFLGFFLSAGFWLASLSRRSYYLKNEKAQLSDDDRRVGALRMSWRIHGLARYMGACVIWAAPWLLTMQAQDVDALTDAVAKLFTIF